MAEWPGTGVLAGGAGHALVVREEGQLWEFGTNQPTSLGSVTNLAVFSTNRFLPRRVGSQVGWSAVEAMGDAQGTGFALREDGSLWGWGDNSLGQLGDGTGASRKTPSSAGSGRVWKTVSARGGAVFAVQQEGTLWAWGLNEPGSGMLGIGRGRGRIQFSPVQIGSASDWRAVQASRGSVTVVTNLLVTTVTNTNTGVVTSVTNRVVQTLSAGQGGAGLRGSGEIWAWGTALVRTTISNVNSTNGLVVALTTNFAPVRIGADADWKQLVFAHEAFALKQDGSLWRYNESSEALEPFPSSTNSNHAGWKVLRGFQTGQGTNATGHIVGLKTNGTVWAWGDNSTGQVDPQLGTEDLQEEPWQITGIDGVEDSGWGEIGVGPGHSLAMTAAGQLYSWGLSGYVPPALQSIPAPVEAPGVTWRSALAGADFSLGIDQDGRIYAWGVTGLANEASALVRFPETVSIGAAVANSDWTETGWKSGVAAFGRLLTGIDTGGSLKSWGNAEAMELSLPWWNPLKVQDEIRDFGQGWSRVTGSRGLTVAFTNTNSAATEQGLAAAVKVEGSLWTWGKTPSVNWGMDRKPQGIRPSGWGRKPGGRTLRWAELMSWRGSGMGACGGGAQTQTANLD